MNIGQLVKFIPNPELEGQEDLAKQCEQKGIDFISSKIYKIKEGDLVDLVAHVPGAQSVLVENVEASQYEIVQ